MLLGPAGWLPTMFALTTNSELSAITTARGDGPTGKLTVSPSR
jgi:hypothetical protein